MSLAAAYRRLWSRLDYDLYWKWELDLCLYTR
jgi:hypothetical protein